MNTAMPALFIGHGSPMLLIENNPFTPSWRHVASTMPTPDAIVCVSAHWQTETVAVTAAAQPPLWYDFYGFDEALYTQQYPAPGSPKLAQALTRMLHGTDVLADDQRGWDHGTWAVLKHMYPQANIPIVQLSLGRHLSPQQHIALARQLLPLHQQGVLILGSGNLIHNLNRVDWQRMHEADFAFDWARQAQTQLLNIIQQGNLDALADYPSLGEAVKTAIPTAEHFLPLLYVLALRQPKETVHSFNTDFVGGALDMTCVKVG